MEGAFGARFDVEGELGAGGMGAVFRAFDRTRGEHVALKTLPRVDPTALLRFKHEFRALEGIAHPNLVRLYELFSDGVEWFFTMELVSGVSFLDWVRPHGAERPEPGVGRDREPASSETALVPGRFVDPKLVERPLDEQRLRNAMSQLADGVSALHRAGKLHRDVKPSNVLVTAEGRVVLLDFGLIVDAMDPYSEGPADRAGTFSYMAPEAIAGEPLGPASDWYAVGAMLYHALAGRLPFSGRLRDVVVAKAAGTAPPAQSFDASAPADLGEIALRLLVREPEQRLTEAEIRRALGSSAIPSDEALPSALVGRNEEARALDEMFARALGGEPGLVLVRGLSGAGKTTLVESFLETVQRGDRALILRGRCYERESVPYKGLDALVDALSERLRGRADLATLLPPDASLVARAFPVLARVPGLAESSAEHDDADPLELRWRAFSALALLFRSLAIARPLVLFVDDFQWSDASSAAFLGDVLRSARGLLVVVTLRDEAFGSARVPSVAEEVLLEGAERGPARARFIDVGSLTPEASEALARRLLAPEEAPRWAPIVATESGGNPLLIQELVRFVRAHGESAATGLTLDRAVESRLAELPQAARRLLEVVVLAGRPLAQSIAVEAAAARGASLEALSALRSTHLAVTSTEGTSETIGPSHDRIRQAVARCIAPDVRLDLHAGLARALEAADAEPAEVSSHYEAAGDRERAGTHAEIAARRAAQSLAFDRAAELWRKARDLRGADPKTTTRLTRALGEALVQAGRGAEAARELLTAAKTSPPRDALELERRAGEQLLRSGHIDEGVEIVARLLRAVDLPYSRSMVGAIASLAAQRAKIRLRGLGFRPRSLSELRPGPLARMDVCFSAASSLGLVDSVRGAELQARHLLLALDAGEPHRVARGLAAEAIYCAATRPRGARVRSVLASVDDLARSMNEPHPLAMASGVRGVVSYLSGRFQDASEHCARAEAILREQCTGVAWDIGSVQLFGSSSLFYLGRLRDLATRVPSLVREALERGDLHTATALATGVRNVAWLAGDDPKTARSETRSALARWSKVGFHLQHYFGILADAQSDLYEGDPVRGRARVLAEWSSLRLLFGVAFFRVEIPDLRARLSLAEARQTRDSTGLLRAVERDAHRLSGAASPWASPMSTLLLAGAASIRGQDVLSRSLYAASARDFNRLGMSLHAAAARWRLFGLERGAAAATASRAVEEWADAEGVVRPERLLGVFAP